MFLLLWSHQDDRQRYCYFFYGVAFLRREAFDAPPHIGLHKIHYQEIFDQMLEVLVRHSQHQPGLQQEFHPMYPQQFHQKF
jgi:hypothetical protein